MNDSFRSKFLLQQWNIWTSARRIVITFGTDDLGSLRMNLHDFDLKVNRFTWFSQLFGTWHKTVSWICNVCKTCKLTLSFLRVTHMSRKLLCVFFCFTTFSVFYFNFFPNKRSYSAWIFSINPITIVLSVFMLTRSLKVCNQKSPSYSWRADYWLIWR